MAILSEKEYIIKTYRNHFSHLSNKKVAIYGIGKNTEIILENFNCDHIVGLMDGTRTGDTIYGKKILSIEEIVALGVSVIIIVARAANIRMIYRRISDVCKKQEIDVYSISGTLLEEEHTPESQPADFSKSGWDALMAKIDSAEVVSFDVFDTLIMRRVLYPRDVFQLMEQQGGAPAHQLRVNTEMELSAQGQHPTIYDIYDAMGEYSPDVELELEERCLVKRDRVCDVLNYACRLGKEVYLVSDMYLPSNILHGILMRQGIKLDKSHILVSCEWKKSKTTGLFNVLRNIVGQKRVLHIGDSYDADIDAAERYGIEDTFHIKSAVAMLETSNAAEVLKYDGKLSNRILIGEFISRQLNNPFLFSDTQGRFFVKDAEVMARDFLAPLIYCFFSWMVKKSSEYGLSDLLLASRDGRIIEKLYNHLQEKGVLLPRMFYFYVSRGVCVLAANIGDGDICHAARMAYAGDLRDMLKSRFGLDESEIIFDASWGPEELALQNREAVLKRSRVMRERYKKYISRLQISPEAKVGFVDFVAAGTCQKALANIVDFDLQGLYFAAVNREMEYKPDTKIDSMFGVLSDFEDRFHLMEDYFFLENVMTSGESTLADFDTNGVPIFYKEQRTSQQLRELEVMHNAILEYADQTLLSIDDAPTVDCNVPDLILHFLQPQYSCMEEKAANQAELVDEFSNRKFQL